MIRHRSSLFLALLLLPLACKSSSSPEDEAARRAAAELGLPHAGRTLVVSSDLRLPPATYLCAAPPSEAGRPARGTILIEGRHGLRLDLSEVVLRGAPAGEDLDHAQGFGIVVRDSSDITIHGGRLGGYKVCILVESSQRVTIEDVAFDGWYGQRLLSTAFAENPSDWLWPHKNDQGEWIENYGGAISFSDCREVVVRRSRGRHGQNGILLTRTQEAEVYDNDFSFLSGWGIALYRSSGNQISHNIFDYCIRGYSHEVYSRGQDSAGILMFERSCDNIVAFNSATHGGDGVFLFAGRDIVEGLAFERGEENPGGSDRNLFYQNDLRFAAANSLEATFSADNLVLKNDLSGSSQHGVWGGYSRGMILFGNRIDDTADAGITIEHGQDCLIANNSFRNNYKALELYWDLNEQDQPFINGSFGKHFETASRGYWIVQNIFVENDQDLVLTDTQQVALRGNLHSGKNELLDIAGGIQAEGEPDVKGDLLRPWLKGRDGRSPSGRLTRVGFLRPNVAVPATVERYAGYAPPAVPGSQSTSALQRGELGGLQTIVMGPFGPWDFRSGEARPARPRPGGALASVSWSARWFAWSLEKSDPRANLAAWRELALQPLYSATVENLLDPYGGDGRARQAVGGRPFGLIARASVAIDRPGRYRLASVSDDGVRVQLDGRVVLENWTWHGAEKDDVELTLAAGTHELVVEYFQIDGAVALSLELERISE